MNLIENKETYAFKFKFMQKKTEVLRKFENEMFNLIKQVKFRKINNSFQDKLANDLKIARKTKSIIVHNSNKKFPLFLTSFDGT